MKSVPRELLFGTAVALLAGLVAFLLARFVLGHLYYLSVLLPAALVAMLLIAWLLHLKADGCFGATKQAQAPEPDDGKHPWLRVTFEDGVIDRPIPVGQLPPPLNVGRVMLWGALELGLVSVALYHWAGVGSRIFR